MSPKAFGLPFDVVGLEEMRRLWSKSNMRTAAAIDADHTGTMTELPRERSVTVMSRAPARGVFCLDAWLCQLYMRVLNDILIATMAEFSAALVPF